MLYNSYMNFFVYALAFFAFIGATIFTVRYNASNVDAPGLSSLLGMALIPSVIILGTSMLMLESGIGLFWVLGTLLAALGAMAIGVWRINMSDTYESGWGVMFYTSVPVWIIGGSLTALVRLL